MAEWRVGKKIPINVYEGDRPVCQCHIEEDAQRIVAAMNAGDQGDAARIDWLERKGTIDIECSIRDWYSIGEQIDEGEEYPSLREAIDAERLGDAKREETAKVNGGDGL